MSWKHVFFLINGTISFDAWKHQIQSEDASGTAHLKMFGTLGLFNEPLLADTSSVKMVTSGVLAALPMEMVQQFFAKEDSFSFKLTFIFGQSALRLAVGVEYSQLADDPDMRS